MQTANHYIKAVQAALTRLNEWRSPEGFALVHTGNYDREVKPEEYPHEIRAELQDLANNAEAAYHAARKESNDKISTKLRIYSFDAWHPHACHKYAGWYMMIDAVEPRNLLSVTITNKPSVAGWVEILHHPNEDYKLTLTGFSKEAKGCSHYDHAKMLLWEMTKLSDKRRIDLDGRERPNVKTLMNSIAHHAGAAFMEAEKEGESCQECKGGNFSISTRRDGGRVWVAFHDHSQAQEARQ